MHRKFLVISFALAALALPSLAQTPNLTGVWKLNIPKSDFGQIPPPTSETQTMVDAEPSLKITTDQKGGMGGDTTTVMNLTTDGKEVTWNASGNEVKSTAQWQGNALVVNSKLSVQGSDVTVKATYTLGEDGKTLNISAQYMTGMGNFDLKAVYDKQDASTATAAAAPATAGAASMIHAGGPAPNLSGTWKLDLLKSDFGQIPPPAGQTDTIEDNEPTVKIAVDQKGGMMGDTSYTTTVSTDGKETTSSGMGGAPVTSTAHWDGAALIVDSKTTFQGADIAIKDNFTLSSDGKTLTEATHIESGMGNFDEKMVYDKM
ncbi:MAG TPA: hypothetical protein VJO53_06820 [Candidatus Acidoferrales bacterium]|nr:hypothetical protein [Candidatus Acidoferrales bacterium]